MSQYPLTTSHFQVEWGGTRIGVTEVLGLAIEIDVIDYKEGASPEDSADVMPGQEKLSTVVLKRGVMRGDNEYFEWLNTVKLNTVERRDLTISLLDENHEPVVVWRLKNAFPIRLEWSTLNARASKPAIETLTVAYEGLTVINDGN